MKSKYILFIIIIVAAFLRFYQLGVNPPSLTWDEVSWGYNAYSLGIDGRDEFGRFLPVDYLESFGDFKPPMYAYLDIVPVKLFGLTEFAVRFPSALFGTLTVLITYFLVKQIFSLNHNLQHKGREKIEIIALLSAGILAISPWHIMLSRAAFEANVATFFLVAGVCCFLYGVDKKPRLLILSAVAFGLSLYIFNTSRIVAPLLVITLVLLFWKKIWHRKKHAMFAAVFGLILLLPLVPFLISPQASLRFKEVNIFSDVSVIKTANQQIENDNNSLFSNIIHNRRMLFGAEYLRHYFDNLTPHFLFINGDGNPKFSTQDVGQMYIWELPFFILGILFLFKFRQGVWYIIPLWLLLGIIPAGTARETPHALRIEATLPTFQILVAYGLVNVYFLMQRFRRIFVMTVAIFAVLTVSYFLHGYYAHYPREYSSEWQYGYKESIAYVKQVQDKYDQIVITNQLGRPYIYYLFYLQIPPAFFREHAVVHRDAFGFVTVESVGKYIFTDDRDHYAGKKTLFIVDGNAKIPSGVTPLKTFYLRDGKPSMVAYSL